MSGRFFFLVPAVVAVALVPTAAGGSTKAPPRVKTVVREIESIAMDGPLVAYDLGRSGCNQVFAWNVETNVSSVVSGKRTCEADSTSTGAGVAEIGIAGRRLAWIVNLGGNTESNDYLYTASLPRPKERLLGSARRTGDVDRVLNGGWIGGLAGDGETLAVSAWSTRNDRITRGALRTIRSSGVKTIARGRSAVVSASVSGNRIAVLRQNGSIGIHSTNGALLKTITARAREVALDGDKLVALTPNGLAVYDARLGAHLRTWGPRRLNAEGLDADSGVAVYTISCQFADQCGGRTYAVRLSDGKTVLLGRPGSDLVGLAIEPAGVVYAVNGLRSRRLVFYSLEQVQARLG